MKNIIIASLSFITFTTCASVNFHNNLQSDNNRNINICETQFNTNKKNYLSQNYPPQKNKIYKTKTEEYMYQKDTLSQIHFPKYIKE